MLETLNAKKTKITLADYNFKKDIENRLLMACLSPLDLAVLEQLLYSPIKTTLKRLGSDTSLSIEELKQALAKLEKAGLFEVKQDEILIDKEMRKYFETELMKFVEGFNPGMEYLQCLLKKVPIHVLPIWYSIPRTSNNIFESIIEKYLITPQAFQRYLTEAPLSDPISLKIMHMVYASDTCMLTAKEIMQALSLTETQFQEHMLLLEFSFICCLSYKRTEKGHEGVVTPFYEWKEYLQFLEKTEINPIRKYEQVQRFLTEDFSFVKDMGLLLQMAKKSPLSLIRKESKYYELTPAVKEEFVSKADLREVSIEKRDYYTLRLLSKLLLLKLADAIDDELHAVEASEYFLEMKPEGRALYIYRHPAVRFGDPTIFNEAVTEKALRECEKSIVRALGKGWVYFDEFLEGVLAPLNDESAVLLKKTGKSWRYTLPVYSAKEKEFIYKCILEWLSEIGIVAKGSLEGRECFIVTSFGASLFSR